MIQHPTCANGILFMHVARMIFEILTEQELLDYNIIRWFRSENFSGYEFAPKSRRVIPGTKGDRPNV